MNKRVGMINVDYKNIMGSIDSYVDNGETIDVKLNGKDLTIDKKELKASNVNKLTIGYVIFTSYLEQAQDLFQLQDLFQH